MSDGALYLLWLAFRAVFVVLGLAYTAARWRVPGPCEPWPTMPRAED